MLWKVRRFVVDFPHCIEWVKRNLPENPIVADLAADYLKIRSEIRKSR